MRKLIVFFLLCLCLSFTDRAEARPRWVTVHRNQQKKQNRFANKHHLTRLKDLAQLEKFIKIKLLVLISDTDAYYLDKEIGKWDKKHKDLYHYARSYVKDFSDNELGACHNETGDAYKINSLVRTYAYQKRVWKYETHGAITGKKWWQQSAHLTGAALDISWKGLSSAGRSCLRKHLRKLGKQGKIISMKESDHYHVMVLTSYK